MDIQRWFHIGMKRVIPCLIPPSGRQITVGGREVTDDRLYRPHWNAANLLPYPDQSVDTIWCNHFMEHLSGEVAVLMLREFQRVLCVGGVANIVIPYYNSQMQAQDPDHRSAWCETSWKTIFDNHYYNDHSTQPWALEVHACFIIGIVERNLSLFTQLVRK